MYNASLKILNFYYFFGIHCVYSLQGACTSAKSDTVGRKKEEKEKTTDDLFKSCEEREREAYLEDTHNGLIEQLIWRSSEKQLPASAIQ